MQFTTLLGLAAWLIAQALAQTTSSVVPTTMTTAASSTGTGLASIVSMLPTCALPCLESAATAINCTTSDLPCLCSRANDLTTNIGPCILFSGCSSSDQTTLINSAQQICANVNAAQPSELAAASSYIASAVASDTAASSTASGSMAWRTEAPVAGMGVMGAAAAFAVLAL